MSIKIVVPYKFTPRSYQMPLFHAMDNGYRHAVLVWSRRTGKDMEALYETIMMHKQTTGLL